jgi:hypothetical protein
LRVNRAIVNGRSCSHPKSLQAQSGNPVDALRKFEEMLNFWRNSSDLMLPSLGLGSLIALFQRLGCDHAAATLHGALVRSMDSSAFLTDLPDTMKRVRVALGDAKFEAAKTLGNAMSLHDATDYALDQIAAALASRGVA